MVGEYEEDRKEPESLDERTEHEWRQLADQVLQWRFRRKSTDVNISLTKAAEREPDAPTAPAFQLWAADNLSIAGDYAAAVDAYDDCIYACESVRPLTPHSNLPVGAMMHKAQALHQSGDLQSAVAAYRELFARHPAQKFAMLEAGFIAERSGDVAKAKEFYDLVACSELTADTGDASQLALRAINRIKRKDANYCRSERELAEFVTTAIERCNPEALRSVAGLTHFAVGPVGGHTGFEDLEMLETFFKELSQGKVKVSGELLGSGQKRYLQTNGWKGRWFQEAVSLILTESPRGWQWTGIAIHNANELWAERWTPEEKQTNQPLPFPISAPWPKGQCFTAGGFWEHIAEAGIVAAAWPFSAAVAAAFAARNCCGWGARGFYYNIGPTHDEEDAFAIDFTRYRRFVPYDNESGGTPVLAVHEGIVSFVRAGISNGDSSTDNRVHIEHADPANPTDLSRFTSKYLHLEGPFRVPVSQGMPVRLGTRLGFMDDTGTSILDHLHFSIHDRQLTFAGAPEGRSVRPSPMDGETLSDSDSNKCIKSSNVDYTGANTVLYPSSFAGQNWLITPAALAVNEAPPRSITEQKWLLVLSGVANINLKGNSSQWLRETFRIVPDTFAPMDYALNQYNIPTPSDYRLRFQVEQWVPYSAPSSMFNKNHSVNSGFAVDVWRPHPFETDFDVDTNAQINRIFSGIQVDVAVSDIDAFFYRLSYHIVLLGRIRFGQPIIIE